MPGFFELDYVKFIQLNRLEIEMDRYIADSSKNYSNFLSNSGLGFCIVDDEQRVILINDILLDRLDLPVEEIVGQPVDNFLSISLFDGESSGLHFTKECSLRKGDVTLEYSYFRINVHQEKVKDDTVQYFVTFFEITDYVRMEDTLWKALEELHDSRLIQSRFLANVNHELRTPLNSILGMTHLLIDSRLPNEHLIRLKKVKNAALHLLHIIDDIIGFKDYEHNVAKLNVVEKFKLDSVLSEFLQLQISEINSDQIRFRIYRDPSMSDKLEGYPVYLGRILQSLVGNAIKYTEKGSIEIDILLESTLNYPDKDNLIINIIDTGHGIKEEYLANLFLPFSQEDSTSTRKFGGLGMGLAVSRKFARRIGGDISVESKLGEGTRFTLRLPVKAYREENNEIVNYLRNKIPRILAIMNSDKCIVVLEKYTEYINGTVYGTSCSGDIEQIIREFKPDIAFVMVTNDRDLDLHKLKSVMEIIAGYKISVIAWCENNHNPLVHDLLGDKVLNMQGLFLPQYFYENLYQLYAVGVEPADSLPFFMNTSILIVEDNIVNQEVVGGILENRGVQPMYASNGESALTMLEDNPEGYDLILMDIQMPGMNGIEACYRIRNSDTNYKNIPIVALTANTDSVDREECMQAGMQDFHVKPIDPSRLLKSLAHLIPDRVEKVQTKSSKGIRNIMELNDSESKRVDLKQGLARTFDNVELFDRIIDQFINSYQNFVIDWEQLNHSGNQEDIVRLAHSLKGVAGNLGLLEVQEISRHLEMTLREKENGDIENMLSSLAVALDFAIRKLMEWKESHGYIANNGVLDGDINFQEVFNRILESVNNNDIGIRDQVRDTPVSSVPEIVQAEWKKLNDALLVFDFDKGRHIVKSISLILEAN